MHIFKMTLILLQDIQLFLVFPISMLQWTPASISRNVIHNWEFLQKPSYYTHMKRKKKEKRERFYIASVFFNLSLIYSTVVLDSFVCVLNGHCYVKSAQYYVHVDMYRSSHMLLKRELKNNAKNTLSFPTENLPV